jgi:hypothetical protein
VSPEAAPAGRLLPTTAATYADYQARVSDIMTKELGGAADLEKAIDTFGAPHGRAPHAAAHTPARCAPLVVGMNLNQNALRVHNLGMAATGTINE